MRQRLIKAIFCFAMSVSVFFCTCIPAFASEVDPADEIGFEVDGGTTKHVGLINLVHDDNQFYGEAPISNYFTLILQPGYVYSGQVTCRFSVVYTPDVNVKQCFSNLYDYSIRSSSSSVGVAFDVVNRSNDDYMSYTCDVIMTFDGLYVENTLPITISYTMNLAVYGTRVGTIDEDLGTVSISTAQDFASRYWTATLPDSFNEGGVIAEQGALDREQQQQIANQQSQQSAQQHDNLVNGYDNAANDNMLADKNSVLQGFEQQQDQAMSNGQQYVSDFSANYDTAPLQAMAPAFMMISTWFNDLWGGMGNFSTVLIVGLMLCVAGYILKLKH